MNGLPLGRGRRNERGATLITATLLLLLISVLVISFLSIVSSERAMSNNVHVARAAIYAADAGIRVAQQTLANTARKRLDSLITLYAGTGPVIKNPTSLFPDGITTATATTPKFTANTSVVFTDSALSVQTQIYNYRYTVTSTGTQGTLGTRTLQSQGILKLSTGRGSFADYLMFTDKHTMPDGSAIWFTTSGHFEGRVHTNGEFRFSGSPTFEDLITSVHPKAWYFNKSSPVELDDDHNKTIDVPKLYGGFKRNQGVVTLPTNSYNQQNAALGLDPTSSTPPSNATIRTQLGLPAGATAPPNGIYVPNLLGLTNGGIYVQGTLTSCVASVDAFGRQVYVLKQGAATRTITLDKSLNLTMVNDGATTANYIGMPRGIMYTVGSISDIGGPARVGSTIPPAIANGTELLVTATGDIVLQRDMTYKDYFDGNSVLGLFSSAGSIRVGSSAPNDVELNGFVMAAASNGCMTVDNYSSGSPRGTFHLNGGIVATYYGAFGTFDSNNKITHGYARDFHFDNRGLVPPYFPTSSQVVSNVPKARTVVWKEQ